MPLPTREQLRAALRTRLEEPAARLLQTAGISPNALTLTGFAVSAIAAALTALGWLIPAGALFLAGGLLDLMDGSLARLTGKATPFGALLDSVFDRLGEAALFLGLALHALQTNHTETYRAYLLTAIILALIFSQGVSYLRARGEGLGVSIRSGLMTRPERVVILSIALLLGSIPWLLPAVLTAIAAISCYTLFQRMFAIRNQLDHPPQNPPNPQTPQTH